MNENWHIVGCIQENVAKKLGMQGRTPIWINDKILKHIEDRHGRELSNMRTSAQAFIHRVVSGFNNAYLQKDGTILLAVVGGQKSLCTYIKLEHATENYWRVKSAHIRSNSELARYKAIWSKPKTTKKPAKKKRQA